MSITQEIRNKIRKIRRGRLFTYQDFSEFGSRSTIDKVLSRLVKSEEIHRATRGIYYRPKISKLFGKMPANVNKVLDKITQKTGETLQRNGADGARLFKSSTQASPSG